MDIETLDQMMSNKLVALDAKKRAAMEKGNFDLFKVFDEEYAKTVVTLAFLRRTLDEVKTYKTKEIQEALKQYLLESLPSLSFYFKESSIHAVVASSLDEAFDRLIKERFIDKLVRLSEE